MFWTNQVQTGQCNRNVVSGRRIAGAMRSLINAKVLHETFLVPVLMYGNASKCMDKGVVRSDEGILWWFSHVERME